MNGPFTIAAIKKAFDEWLSENTGVSSDLNTEWKKFKKYLLGEVKRQATRKADR